MTLSRRERLRQIGEVLARYGWESAGQLLGGHLPTLRLPHRPGRTAAQRESGPVRLRRTFEDLGPTYIKLGQMLATREDVLPPAYAQELARLQDGTAPIPGEQVEAVIREQLGAGVEELFGSFETTALAAASLGQTHRATLHDGTAVVVKVRRPGVAEEVEVDLELMHEMAEIAVRESTTLRDLGLLDIVTAFETSLRRELDYTVEADSAERFRANLATDPAVHIPAVYRDLCTAQVLTEERVAGDRITDTAALDARGIDRPALADAASRTVVHMVLVDGFFHADPHPGNIFVREDGGLWLIDFGMVGELDEATRTELLWLVLSLASKDPDTVSRRLLQLAPPRGRVSHRRLREDVAALLDTVSGTSFAEMSMSAFFSQLMALVQRHRLQLPPSVALLLRMLVLLEASAAVLDPDFHLGRVLQEVGYSALLDRWGPKALAEHAAGEVRSVARTAAGLPERLLALLEDYEDEGVRARLDPADLEPLVQRIESTGDRVIAGVTMSALLVSLGTVISAADGRAGRLRDPLMIAAGGAAGLLGAYLAAGAGPGRSLRRAARRYLG